MNTQNYLLLEDLLEDHIAKLLNKLSKNQKSRELRQDLGHPTMIHDLTEQALSAKLILAQETMAQLIDWSNQ